MNNKRVGTITFGIFMIVLGCVLLIGLTTSIKSLDLLIKFWPLLLISIGSEILVHHYRVGKENKLRFDIASMFILFMFGSTAIALYAFQASGIGDLVNELGQSSTYAIDISKKDIQVKENTERIVIENNLQNLLKVYVEDRKDVSIDGTLNVIAPNRSMAKSLVEMNKIYNVEVKGNSLVIKTNTMRIGKWILKEFTNATPLIITIPSDVPLFLESNHGDTSVIANKINASWFVRQEKGVLDVIVPKDANARVGAHTRYINGNLKFESRYSNIGLENTKEVTTTVISKTTDNTSNYEYSTILGRGEYMLNLVNPRGTIGVYTDSH